MRTTSSLCGRVIAGAVPTQVFPAIGAAPLAMKINDINSGLTLDVLKDRLIYEPDTGLFYRKKWSRNGSPTGWVQHGYIMVSIGFSTFFAHRLAWFYTYGIWPKECLDHINRNKLDNRISNLREATHAENMRNVNIRKHSKSGIKGVRFIKGKWQARIVLDRVQQHLGVFNTAEEASAAYVAASRKMFKEFAP